MWQSTRKLSDELKELSGWEWDQVDGYSLAFLLRKLPDHDPETGGRVVAHIERESEASSYQTFSWIARWYIVNDDGSTGGYAHGASDTPEDAAAKLCCILFQQGILTRKGEK